MPKIKLTKTAVDAATPQERDYELRDTIIPGFLVKVTPTGRKIFMVAYVAHNGQRRKPAIGRYGEITVEQARNIAQDWLAEVRRGVDPSAERAAARQALTVKELFDRFITDYSESRNKPTTVESNRGYGKRYIIPILGQLKVPDVTRADIAHLMKKMGKSPTNANRVLAAVRKMFNMAEVWGLRPDGSNPCRHVPKYPERGKTRLITDVELRKLFEYLDRADAEGLEHPFILLAIRLQFEFAARMSEILQLQWAWIDFDNRRVVWPDSKTGGMSKPMSAEAFRLFKTAPRLEKSPFVCPSVFDPNLPMSKHTYYQGWRRILQRAGLPHIGTHGIRHRSATDIANSGIPVKVGMALTAHKTVTMFMKYVHTEDDPVRAAAETVAQRRMSIVGGIQPPAREPVMTPEPPSVAPVVELAEPAVGLDGKPLGFEDGAYTVLGPPLPGDLGRPILDAQNRGQPVVPPTITTPTVDEAEQRRIAEEEAARTSRVFFQTQPGMTPAAPGGSATPGIPGVDLAGLAGQAGQQTAQDRQNAFLNGPVDRRTTSSDRVMAPASPFVLQAGAVIPAALITGIRSDLPGQITAQVTENIYDSPTGRSLLVPQGTRIIGQYDNNVQFGQRRVLLVWNRLIFPNGRSIVLERQPGADTQGYAGLEDGVDYHWWDLAKAAGLSTLLAVGTELAVSDEDRLVRAIRDGAQDTINDAGQQIVRRQLQVAPTLTIRPGFPVRVIVTRDLVLEPYRG